MLVFALTATAVLPLGSQALKSNPRLDGDGKGSRNMSQLVIHAPSSILEGQMFLVLITDQHNQSIRNASVMFLNHTYYTNENGQVWLTAPMVDETLDTEIYAWAFEYLPDSVSITIINEMEQLVIHAPASVLAGEDFLVIVGANCNESVANASITTGWTMNETFYTDENGELILSAPLVEYPLYSWIKAEKDGYLSDLVWITIETGGQNYTIGDVNGDGIVSFGDINPFVYVLTHTQSEFNTTYPDGHYWAADCNQDGQVDFGDINPFVAILTG